MKKIALLIMMFIFLTCKTACGQADSLQDHSIAGADRDDFITVSMLVASPQRALYSVFGHAVLRLQSPSNNLDYVFTFESQPNMGTFITGVLGKARAHYVAVPAEQYIDDMRKDNRELWQYKLNLKPQEKQELWRILDSELQSGDYRYFNILYTNCLTTSVVNLQRSLMNEHVEWGEPIFPMMLSNGEVLRYTLRNSKWTEFLFVTFGGLAYGRHTPNESRLIPEVIIPMLRQAKIVENETGKSRPEGNQRQAVGCFTHDGLWLAVAHRSDGNSLRMVTRMAETGAYLRCVAVWYSDPCRIVDAFGYHLFRVVLQHLELVLCGILACAVVVMVHVWQKEQQKDTATQTQGHALLAGI